MTAEQLEATRREVEIREMVCDLAPHQPEVAEVLAYLFDRADAQDREIRQLRTRLAGLVGRVDTLAAPIDSRDLAERVAYREYAQSGAYDPRD